MRQPSDVRRYALARSGAPGSRPEERVRHLRLVRMEAIAESDRERERELEPAREQEHPPRPS